MDGILSTPGCDRPCTLLIWILVLTHRPDFLAWPWTCLITFLENIELWLYWLLSLDMTDHGCDLLTCFPYLTLDLPHHSRWSRLVAGPCVCHQTCSTHLAQICGTASLLVRSMSFLALLLCMLLATCPRQSSLLLLLSAPAVISRVWVAWTVGCHV